MTDNPPPTPTLPEDTARQLVLDYCHARRELADYYHHEHWEGVASCSGKVLSGLGYTPAQLDGLYAYWVDRQQRYERLVNDAPGGFFTWTPTFSDRTFPFLEEP